MTERYLVTINKISMDGLKKDKLTVNDLPEALNTATEKIAPHGSIDLELVYLLADGTHEQALAAIEKHAVPYPRHPPKPALRVIQSKEPN